jgi:DNA polymerase-4
LNGREADNPLYHNRLRKKLLMRPRWFGHVDMDAFYASVEVLDDPRLRGLPVAVGGPSDQRGVIAAASYPARRFGVHSAMPTGQALRLCPDLILLPGRMARYQGKSREVMEELRAVAPRVEPLSLDEAALDLTGCERLHGDWAGFALRLRRRIFDRTGLWASVGLGETRRIAKIASDLRKPRGVAVVERGAGAGFLAGLPLERLWGVGPKLRARLDALGMHTVADVARTPRPRLQALLGKTGLALHDVVHAREGGSVHPDREPQSVSHETTFARDKVGAASLEPVLLHLAEKVAGRMRRHGIQGRVVQLKIRDRSFRTLTRRTTLTVPVDSEHDIFAAARRLLHQLHWENVPVRLVGVGVSHLSATEGRQGDLFASRVDRQRPNLERVLDDVHQRFGQQSIGRALGLLQNGHGWQDELWTPLDEHPASPSLSHGREPSRSRGKDRHGV